MELKLEPIGFPWEVFFVGTVISLAPLLVRTVLRFLFPRACYWPCLFLQEFISVFLPVLLLMTRSVSPKDSFLLTLIAALCLIIPSMCALTDERAVQILKALHGPRLRYLDDFRGDFMVATCIAILAVDFQIFPVQFAKSDTYGATLMDLGPGIIIFAGGLVSKPIPRSKGFRRSLCLISFGLIRLATTVLTGYHVNVNEYGVHWNFFLTLAGVSFLRSLFPLHGVASGLVAAILLISYQLVLSSGFNLYLYSHDLDKHLIHQNKEGIFSLIGYFSLHLLGTLIGQTLTSSAKECWKRACKNKKNLRTASSGRLMLLLWYLSLLGLIILLILLTNLSEDVFEPISRRFCNMSYVLWMVAYSLVQCFWKISIQVCELEEATFISKSINKNLFGVFLAANLMTGIVNLSMDTEQQSNWIAIFVLSCYGTILITGAALAETYQIYFKLG